MPLDPPIAFLFAFVPKMPRSTTEAMKVRAIYEQVNTVRIFCARSGVPDPKFMAGVSTYRKALFTDNAVFKQALSLAANSGRRVMVSDISGLLRSTDPAKVSRGLERLDEIGANLFDCLTERTWDQFTASDRLRILQEATTRRGLEKVAKPKQQDGGRDTTPNSIRGAAANKIRADQEAARLEPIISSLEKTLPPGASLTPATVMHHLNAVGEKPRRAKQWSNNGAKNLLARLMASEPHDK